MNYVYVHSDVKQWLVTYELYQDKTRMELFLMKEVLSFSLYIRLTSLNKCFLFQARCNYSEPINNLHLV